MTILFIAMIAVVPAIIGREALILCFQRKKKPEIWESYIMGTLLCILMGEAVHLCTVFLHWPFHRFCRLYGILLGTAFVLAALPAVSGRWKKGKKQVQKGRESTAASGVAKLWLLGLGAIILFQCIFHIVMHTPDIQFDITLENVTDMLASDTVYQRNPLTGQAYEMGMPMRLKILALPSIYAAFCRWFSLDAQTVVYNLIPMFVLILSYMVLFGWARYFYPKQEEKQRLFLFFAAALLQFGNYAVMTVSYGLFHMGYRGEVFCIGVLYPYLLLLCLKKRKLSVLLCLIAEIGLVWTWYGLGAGVLIVLITVISFLLSKAVDERRKKA